MECWKFYSPSIFSSTLSRLIRAHTYHFLTFTIDIHGTSAEFYGLRQFRLKFMSTLVWYVAQMNKIFLPKTLGMKNAIYQKLCLVFVQTFWLKTRNYYQNMLRKSTLIFFLFKNPPPTWFHPDFPRFPQFCSKYFLSGLNESPLYGVSVLERSYCITLITKIADFCNFGQSFARN